MYSKFNNLLFFYRFGCAKVLIFFEMAYILLNIPYYYLFWGESSIAFLLRLPLVNKVLDAFQSRVVAFGTNDLVGVV